MLTPAGLRGRRRLCALLAGLAGACLAPAAAAVEVHVNPVRIVLSPAAASQLITLTNNSDQAASFQVSVFRWTMDEAGESRLEPSGEILFFPRLLELRPRAERKLRVGAAGEIRGEREESFRLIVEELPGERNRSSLSVRLLTRLSLPVFLAPSKPVRELGIEAAALAAGKLRFRTRNGGNVHLPPHRLRIAFRGAAGDEVFARELEGWYLLPGRSRSHEIAIPAETCPRVKAVEILAGVEGEVFTHRLEAGERVCSP